MSTQYHLKGKGFSGRAVRVEALEPDAAESNLLAAAKLAGAEATGLEVKKTEWRNGVKLFIKQYSEPCTKPTDPEVKWKTPRPGDFDNIGEYFTTKDIQALEHIFRELHEVSADEISAIVGEAISLSED